MNKAALNQTIKKLKNKFNIPDSGFKRYLEERLIMVNSEDEPIGSLSLLEAHLNENIKESSDFHRAFSVIIVDQEKNMLIQKRADDKLIFPGRWANSCCSHPLFNLEQEREMKENLGILII